MDTPDNISKTRVILRNEIEHGCRDPSKIWKDDAIELALSFIDEYRSKSHLHQSIKEFLSYEDKKAQELQELKWKIASSVIEENYDDIDVIFEEIHEEVMNDILRERDYY